MQVHQGAFTSSGASLPAPDRRTVLVLRSVCSYRFSSGCPFLPVQSRLARRRAIVCVSSVAQRAGLHRIAAKQRARMGGETVHRGE